jgi:hypothetical protein
MQCGVAMHCVAQQGRRLPAELTLLIVEHTMAASGIPLSRPVVG